MVVSRKEMFSAGRPRWKESKADYSYQLLRVYEWRLMAEQSRCNGA